MFVNAGQNQDSRPTPLPSTAVEELAPGAVSAESLDQARLILNPSIQFVRITRPNWIKTIGQEISSILGTSISKSSDSTYSFGHAREGGPLTLHMPDWAFQLVSHSEATVHAWQLVLRDANFIRNAMIELTGSRIANSTIRAELKNCSPGMHFDVQAITFGVAYLGGGTVVRLSDQRLLQLALGEIGIWKGRIEDDLGTWINHGQALAHSATEDPAHYPRLIGLHDMRDVTLPKAVLDSLRPWSVPDTSPVSTEEI